MWGLHMSILSYWIVLLPGYRIDSGDQHSTMMMTGRLSSQ